MNGTVLLFGFDSLLSILALEAAVGPLGAEVVPVAKQITIRPWQYWRGWTQHRGRAALRRGNPGRKNGSAVRLGWPAGCGAGSAE